MLKESTKAVKVVTTIRTDATNPDFIQLVKHLDTYLAEIDGEDHLFYAQFNKVDQMKYVVVAYVNGNPAGCGAIKDYAPGIMEIKRMYTSPESRGKGVATMVLNELESWAAEMSFDKCLLETGKKQQDAIRLYNRNGYQIVSNYGKYVDIENSVCFEKRIK